MPEDMKQMKLYLDASKLGAETLRLQMHTTFKKEIEEAKKKSAEAKSMKEYYMSVFDDSFNATEDVKTQSNSNEFKKKREELLKGNKELDVFFKYFNNSEMKKQIEDMKELKSSPEYKKLKKKFDEDLEKIKKKKGINTDIRAIKYSDTDPVMMMLKQRDSI